MTTAGRAAGAEGRLHRRPRRVDRRDRGGDRLRRKRGQDRLLRRGQTIANADAALRLDVNGGDAIAIDFDASILTVNGVARTGAAIDSFFAQYAASPQNVLTIGSIGGPSFAVADLVLDRVGFEGPPVNTAPSVSLTPLLTSLPENTNTERPIKVADIVVTDDGIGVNTLRSPERTPTSSRSSATASSSRPAAALELRHQPTLDVTVDGGRQVRRRGTG